MVAVGFILSVLTDKIKLLWFVVICNLACLRPQTGMAPYNARLILSYVLGTIPTRS